MANTFQLNIATPEKSFFEGEVEALVVKTTEGEVEILQNHVPFLAVLVPYPMHFKMNGEWEYAALTGGFMRIKKNEVQIFADTAEWPDDIELGRVLEAKKRAEERLQNRASEIEYMQSRVALDRALTRLTVKTSRES